jgi:hypothetical protein
MTGFGVDVDHLSAIGGRVLGLRDTLTGAAGAVAGTGQGDFGHEELNQVVSELSGLVHEALSGLGETVHGMADNVIATAQSYAATDSSNAKRLTGLSRNE